jgi:hypothetical protein
VNVSAEHPTYSDLELRVYWPIFGQRVSTHCAALLLCKKHKLAMPISLSLPWVWKRPAGLSEPRQPINFGFNNS